MGEYAVGRMKKDFKRLTGVEADDSDFDSPPKRISKNKCQLCGKRLRNAIGVIHHMKDKHGKG